MRWVTTVVWFLAALSGACIISEPRTQVMLIVDADANVRALATDLQLSIQGRNAQGQVDGPPRSYTFRPKDVGSSGWPFSVALVPRSRELERSYILTAVVSNGPTLLAVLRAQGGFVARKTLALRLSFAEACLNAASLQCSSEETCQSGSCVSANVDAITLPPFDAMGSVSGTSVAADGGGAVLMDASAAASSSDAAAGSGDGGAPPPRGESPGDCGDGVLNPGELCDTGITQGAGACPSACASAGCMSALLEGSACQTKCAQYEIMASASGDGCCPAGADSTTDSDCVVQCGNGRVESGETCEAGDPMHPCPTADSCRVDKCLIGTIKGDAASCTAICETQLMEQCVSGDGCCPSSCTHDLDSDCSASCGNGVVDATAGETCDTGNAVTPCPSACDDGDVCTRDYLTGSASNCSASCSYVRITAPFSGDGCCPPGANASNDLDCMPSCGNGVLERGELCDLNCPTQVACDDHNPCTSDQVTGSDCNVMCTHSEVRAARSGDGCCPSGANANNDSDCAAVCGNGVVEAGEDCDGDCPTSCGRSGTCSQSMLTGAPCHVRCVSQRITSARNNDGCCPSGATTLSDNDCQPVCGNGVKEGDEVCDGTCGDCPEPPDACTMYTYTDTGGDRCHPTCVPSPRSVSGKTKDGCCPNGGNSGVDADCVPACGNGVTEGDEVCDGNCGDCPAPPDACTMYTYTDRGGDRCHPTCTPSQRAASGRTRDGCCPRGASNADDVDCGAVCGNGVVEGDEICDQNCRACPSSTDPCVYYQPVEGRDECHPSCVRFQRTASGRSRDGCCPDGASPDEDSDC